MGSFDTAFAYARIITTALGDAAKQVLVNVRAFQDGTSEDDADAEGSTSEPLYGAIGVISRPRDADADGAAELVVARGTDNMTPIAGRDLRIVNVRGNVNKGSVSLAGYGGGFVSIEDTVAKTSSIVIAYAPYPGSPPPKAHSITMDTTAGNESITVMHAEGHGVFLTKDKATTIKNAAGDAFIACDPDGVTISGDVKLGNNLIIGAANLATDGVVLSVQLLTWIGQVNTAITTFKSLIEGAGIPVVGGGGGTAKGPTGVTPPSATPVASQKVKVQPP